MKIAELKNKDRAELEALLKDDQVKLGKLVFQRTAKTLAKSSDLGKLKKEIAQINTLLHGTNQ